MVSEELEVLKIVAQRLGDSGINYMVSGSIAANFYAQPRMTRDIDVIVQLSGAAIDKVYNLFKDDFYIEREAISEAIKNRGMFNIIHDEKVIKIDFIISSDAEYENVKFQRKLKKNIENIDLPVISPEDLILSKLAWAKDSRSEMQFGDVKNIIAFNKDTLDFNYLESWAMKLSLKDMLQECMSV